MTVKDFNVKHKSSQHKGFGSKTCASLGIFKYYYFRVFKYYSNGDIIPYFSTFAIIFVFLLINFLTVLGVFSAILNFGFNMPELNGLKFIPALIFILLLYYYYYYNFVKSGKHVKLLEEFVEENKQQKKKSIIFTLLYFSMSIISFIIVVTLK